MAVKEDMEFAPSHEHIKCPNVHLYLEQFLLRDKWTASAQQREKHQIEEIKELWEPTRNLREPSETEEPVSTTVYMPPALG